MAIALRRKQVLVNFIRQNPLIDMAIFCAAGLFVSILLMTYGIDLSPGLF